MAINYSAQELSLQATCVVYALNERGRKSHEVCRRTVETNTFFVPDELFTLAPGRYAMVVSVLDERGRRCSVRHDFTLFSLADRRPPIHTPEWFYQDGKEFEGDRPVHLYVGSSEKDVYLFYDVFCGDKRIESKRMILDNEIRRFTYSYKLEYGNGITVRFVFMREGKLYSKQVRITRPHSENICN